MGKLSAAFILLFIISSGLTADSQKKIESNFIPPLNINPLVSGTFGELRTNHFHSGLDLSTSGVIGIPILAIEDGYVSRIKVSGTGYGKALYIDHNNGYTSVYGHMDAYSRKIDSLVVEYQYKNQTFEFDFYPESDKVMVKKGDIIGYSGNSGGSGGPHLHFEIRETRSQRAMNPLLFYTHIKDNISPTVRRVRLYPLTPYSTVNGKKSAQTFTVVKGNGGYRLESENPVKVSGTVGVGIDAIDRFTGSDNNCGVFSIMMYVNNEKHFKSEVDKFAFDESRYINSHIDFAYKCNTHQVVQKSYLEPNNKLSIYNLKVNDGKIDIEKDSIYQIRYEILDAHGNASLVKFKLKGIEAAAGSKPEIEPELLVWNQNYNFYDNLYSVKIDKNSFYTDVDFDITVLPKRKTDISERIKIGDKTIPVHKNISIGIKVPENIISNQDQLTLAMVDDAGKLSYAGGTFNDGWLNHKTRDLGVYVLTIDSISPNVALRNNADNQNYTNKKTLELTITDNFSGIASYRCEVDGHWELFEHDPKTNRLICPLAKTKISKNKSKHKLEVKATDGCGNTVNKSFSFVY